jgi:CheY-like chemotaxis protein
MRRLGYDVDVRLVRGPDDLRAVRKQPPDLLLIDLSRQPSQGRSVATVLRQQKATRMVPIVFAGGERDKVEQVQEVLPDAVYTEWSSIVSAMREAFAHPPEDPVVPGAMDAYSHTPLPRKLGIRPGTCMTLLGAPPDFDKKLAPLPEDVHLRRQSRGQADIVLLFAGSRNDLERRLPRVDPILAPGGRLWIAWPKKASGVESDLSQPVVRAAGMEAGLVDYKICSIDETWSGLCFARRPAGVGS